MVMPYVLLFIAVVVEGPLATLAAAALAARDPMWDTSTVLAVAMSANLTADICWFFLGSIGKHAGILRCIPWIRYQNGLVERAALEIRHQGIKVFILTKLSFGIGTIPLLVAAGMLHVQWKQWLLAAICTEAVWSGALVAAGTFAGMHFQSTLEALLQNALLWGSSILLGGVALLFLRKMSLHKRATKGPG